MAHEIETQAVAAQQQIGLARTQIAAKQREERLVQLTLSEMASLSPNVVVYEGVGKMYLCFPPISQNVLSLTLPCCRFSAIPVMKLRQKLNDQTEHLENDVEQLNKRLLYLETTHKNSRDHIEQMLRGR